MSDAVQTIAIITVASNARLAHLTRQQELLDELDDERVIRVIAWLDAEEPPLLPRGRTVHVPPGTRGLRVAEGRNTAARAALRADAGLLVFLDADCLAGPELLDRYADAASTHPRSVLSGPVTYLAEDERPSSLDELAPLTRPHPARPAPAASGIVRAAAEEYDLFWSLSFAATPSTWHAVGGFSPAYEGYGAEDTDFAWRARARSVPMHWVGGAHAYHQWHPTSSPPWQHVDDILRNGATFAEVWGRWPMTGWLEAFADAGVIRQDGRGWIRT